MLASTQVKVWSVCGQCVVGVVGRALLLTVLAVPPKSAWTRWGGVVVSEGLVDADLVRGAERLAYDV